MSRAANLHNWFEWLHIVIVKYLTKYIMWWICNCKQLNILTNWWKHLKQDSERKVESPLRKTLPGVFLRYTAEQFLFCSEDKMFCVYLKRFTRNIYHTFIFIWICTVVFSKLQILTSIIVLCWWNRSSDVVCAKYASCH